MVDPLGRPPRPSRNNNILENRLIPWRFHARRDEGESVVERRFAAASSKSRMFSAEIIPENCTGSVDNVDSPDPISAFVRARVNGAVMASPPIPRIIIHNHVDDHRARVSAHHDNVVHLTRASAGETIEMATQTAEQISISNVTGGSSGFRGLRRWLRRFSFRPAAKDNEDESKPRRLLRYRSQQNEAETNLLGDTVDSTTPTSGNDTAIALNNHHDDSNSTPWASGSWHHSKENHVELRFCVTVDSSDVETVYRIV